MNESRALLVRGRQSPLSQQSRLLSAVIYLAVLLLLARYLNGQFLPPYGLEGLWFYSGAAVLLLADFMLEPHFTTPVDALASAITVLLAVATVSVNDAAIHPGVASNGRLAMIIGAIIVVASALVAMVFKDARPPWDKVAGTATTLVGRFARARWLFSGLLLAGGFAAFANSGSKIAALYLTWFGIVGLRPVEGAVRLATSGAEKRARADGRVEDLHDPAVIGARLKPGADPKLGDKARLGANEAFGTIVDVTELAPRPYVRVALETSVPITIGTEVELTGDKDDRPVIGHIDEGSTIDEAVITAVAAASDIGVEEGRLLEINVNQVPTLYQVVAATVSSRSEAGIRRQLIQVRGRKLGMWSEERTDFEHVAWIPAPGTPVRLLQIPATLEFEDRFVGQVPGTTYGVKVNPHLAVTHNTAILGILGVGKTHLSWELIRRMLTDNIKVVALDITGRHSDHFQDVCPPQVEETIAGEIDNRIRENFGNRNVRDDEAGNLRDFEAALKDCLTRFVTSDDRLLILNPNRFSVDRMDGRPFQGEANKLTTLTMVDVTRLVAEQLLVLTQGMERHPTDENASICLVFEEAHSLIPEWNSVAVESDKEAVNGTARAVLQGRKYGFGCLLVTQRTANVTKSVLNQCNTVFGMRSFDATGMGFLENYIGPAYSRLLASLQDRQAVVFGRASSCASPLIIELNDSAIFLDYYWASRAPEVPMTAPDHGAQGSPEGTPF